MKYDDVLREVLKKIKPDKEKIKNMKLFSERLITIASNVLKPLNARPMICGSVAKNTWLAEKNEADLFMIFPESIPRDKFEKIGLEVAKNIVSKLNGKYTIAYAEHPYISSEITFNGAVFDVDIVPCYDTQPEKIKSAVDRTPHHVKYVIKNLAKPDDVRLLKAFMKSAMCYGADVKTQGFSGYLCELLIIYFGSFMNCIKEASKWRSGGIILSIEKDKKKNACNFKAPLIFLDPVDPNRNAAAAVSSRSLFMFVRAVRDFLAYPSPSFFFERKIKPYSINEIKRAVHSRGTKIVAIYFKRPDVVDDTLYPQLRRCGKIINTLLEKNGFKTLQYAEYATAHECVLVFEFESWLVSYIRKHLGPSVYDRHAAGFLEHYKEWDIGVEDDFWFVEHKREFRTAEELIKNIISSKVSSEIGVPSSLINVIKDAKTYSDEDFFALCQQLGAGFGLFLRQLFEHNLNIVV